MHFLQYACAEKKKLFVSIFDILKTLHKILSQFSTILGGEGPVPYARMVLLALNILLTSGHDLRLGFVDFLGRILNFARL